MNSVPIRLDLIFVSNTELSEIESKAGVTYESALALIKRIDSYKETLIFTLASMAAIGVFVLGLYEFRHAFRYDFASDSFFSLFGFIFLSVLLLLGVFVSVILFCLFAWAPIEWGLEKTLLSFRLVKDLERINKNNAIVVMSERKAIEEDVEYLINHSIESAGNPSHLAGYVEDVKLQSTVTHIAQYYFFMATQTLNSTKDKNIIDGTIAWTRNLYALLSFVVSAETTKLYDAVLSEARVQNPSLDPTNINEIKVLLDNYIGRKEFLLSDEYNHSYLGMFDDYLRTKNLTP